MFFPQPAWLIDAIHERIVPLPDYQPTTDRTLGALVADARAGV